MRTAKARIYPALCAREPSAAIATVVAVAANFLDLFEIASLARVAETARNLIRSTRFSQRRNGTGSCSRAVCVCMFLDIILPENK